MNNLIEVAKYYDSIIDFPNYLGIVLPELEFNPDRDFKIICPLHEDTDPSFSYSHNMGIWTCFGSCHMSGKMVAFHNKLLKNKYGESNVTMLDTLRDLQKMFPTILPEISTIKERKASSAEDRLLNIIKEIKEPKKRIVLTRNSDINDFLLSEFLRDSKEVDAF